MTNTKSANETPATATELIMTQAIADASLLSRDALRKYASKLHVKNASKLNKTDLLDAVIAGIHAHFADAIENEKRESKPAPKIKSAHADCTHETTKSARAKCRRERAKN